MAIGRLALPTAKNRRKQSTIQNNHDKHKCRIKDASVIMPEYEIELYWKKEKQWWYLDRRTILHEFYYASDKVECGTCIATWLSRKNVKCKWRRLSDDNDYSEEEESESESEQLGDRRKRRAVMVTPLKNQTQLEESSDDEDNELSNIGCTSWWDSESDSSEDENDGDYKPYKKQQSIRPCCEATEAMFGNKRIVKGGVYEKRVGHDIWLVKVIEFTGKGARCQLIYYLHAAISDCFPQYDGDCIREDRRTVVNQSSIRDSDFLQTVTESKADFELCRKCAVFLLRCDKKNKVIFELTRRRLKEPNSIVTKRNDTAKPTELVLFAGIGGSSLGDKQAGFDVKWLVENDHLAAASLKINHSDATIYEEDVQLFLLKCEEGKDGYPTVGEVDNLQGSPSCRGFSRLNRGGKHDDKNNLLSQQMVRATRILHPLTVLPIAVRAIVGWQPGQYIIQKAFPFTNQGGTTNVDVSNHDVFDEYDENESGETNMRKFLTWGSIVYILNSIGKDMFNDILRLMGVNNARVVEKDDKYYLEIDNKVYWAHYDRINGYDDLNAAGVIGWDYINGNYNCEECRDRLLKMNWNEDDSEWVVNEEVLEYPLQTTIHALATLYTDVDMSNNEKQLMKSRFTALQSKIKDGLEEDDEFNLYLTTFSTPERWNELNKFFEHIDTLDDICDDDANDDASVFKEKYCMPKGGIAVYEYFGRLRTRDSISTKLMRDAMKGTKYEHLVDIEKYKDLCYEMEVARAQQKGGDKAADGTTRNKANAAGGGGTVFAPEEDFVEDSDDE